MRDANTAPRTFGEEHFGAAELGDRRRTRRLVQTADRIVQHPGGTLPDKLASPAALEGLYRLVDQPRVTHAAVLDAHRRRTAGRMRDYRGTVLTIHDTTALDSTGKKSLKRLGQVGNSHHRGYLCHNTLALGYAGRHEVEVLGLANQILFSRPRVPKKESRRARRARRTRESRLWRRGSQAVRPLAGGVPQRVDVCDRGGDLFEYLDDQHAHAEAYVVRAAQDRRLFVDGPGGAQPGRLFAYARALPELGSREVDVPAKDGQPARQARVRVAAGAVRLRPPRHRRGEHGDEPLAVWVVRVWEAAPPAGTEPLEWVLLTNVAAEGFAAACARVDWYACRWVVEELHKALKTGCAIAQLQFKREERLQPVIALLSVVGVFLLQLRDWSRRPEAKRRPATEVVPRPWVVVLSTWRQQAPQEGWTVHEFFQALARRGGHQNRKVDGLPGWLTIWRGWTKLQAMIAGAALAEQARCAAN
jgi:hypothetical protein